MLIYLTRGGILRKSIWLALILGGAPNTNLGKRDFFQDFQWAVTWLRKTRLLPRFSMGRNLKFLSHTNFKGSHEPITWGNYKGTSQVFSSSCHSWKPQRTWDISSGNKLLWVKVASQVEFSYKLSNYLISKPFRFSKNRG